MAQLFFDHQLVLVNFSPALFCYWCGKLAHNITCSQNHIYHVSSIEIFISISHYILTAPRQVEVPKLIFMQSAQM